MAHLCDCGEELVVTVSGTKRTTYCQNCGREEEETLTPAPQNAPVISIQRAKILQQVKSPPPPKKEKVKQLRDRTDYTKARRAARR